jgi:hypothetical protein
MRAAFGAAWLTGWSAREYVTSSVSHDRRPAGRRVRLALLGFGYWGPNYARVLNDLPGADLIVVCDPATYFIDPEALAAAITPRTRAVTPVGLFGQPVDTDAVTAVARRHNLVVIENTP